MSKEFSFKIEGANVIVKVDENGIETFILNTLITLSGNSTDEINALFSGHDGYDSIDNVWSDVQDIIQKDPNVTAWIAYDDGVLTQSGSSDYDAAGHDMTRDPGDLDSFIEDDDNNGLFRSRELEELSMTFEPEGSVVNERDNEANLLVSYDRNGKPLPPARPSPLSETKDVSESVDYKQLWAAYREAVVVWKATQSPASDVTLAPTPLINIGNDGNEASNQLEETQQETQAEQQSAFNRWITNPLKISKMTQEEKLQQDIETMINRDEIIIYEGRSGSPRIYEVNIPTIGLFSGEIPSDVDVGNSDALKAVVVAKFKDAFIKGENVIPPIDFSDSDVMAEYMEQMREINKAAYEINKPAILRNEGFFGRLGDLASRDRADKSYKDQFKELVPEQMREAFLVRCVTVGVAGIDQKTIEMKDLPDYYKAQIKSKKSQLIGISKAAGGTSVEDYNELKAQIEDCKVMERSLRIIVDAAHDPRINSAQFLDMQKACMEDISKRMEAAGRRYQAFKEGITIKNTAIALGSTGALATAGYFMYGWINSGAATANAISDLAAIQAWFQGAGATMGSGFATAGSWFQGAGATMDSGFATAGSWFTGAGLTIETGLISAGLLTAAGALTATGIGAVVVLGVGMIAAIDHLANDGKLRKAMVQEIGDFYKATVGLVSSVAKNVNHQIQQVRLERGHYKPGTKNLFLEEGHEKVFKAVEDAVLSGIVALSVSNHGAAQQLDLLRSISPKLTTVEKVEYEATRKNQRIDEPINAHNAKPHVYRDAEGGLLIAPAGHDKMRKELVSEHLAFLKKAMEQLDQMLIEHHGEISHQTTGQINLLRDSLKQEIKVADLSLKALTYGIAETAVKDAVKRVVLGGIAKERVQANLDYAREKVGNLGSKVSEVEKDVEAKSKAVVGAKLLLAAAVETLGEAKAKLADSPDDEKLKDIMKAEQHKHDKATQRLSTAKQNLEQAKRSLSGLEKDMRKAVTEVGKLEKELAASTRGERARAAGTAVRQAIVGLTLEEAQAEVDDLNKQFESLLDSLGGALGEEAQQNMQEELTKLDSKIKAAEQRLYNIQAQAPSFFQSFKESWDLDAAGTIAKLKKARARHEKVQDLLTTPNLSDERKRANQRDARILRMEIRNLICQLEAKGKFDAAYGAGNLPGDEQVLITIKDQMIEEALEDINELKTNELKPVDDAYNASPKQVSPRTEEESIASVAELKILEQAIQSLQDNRKVIVDRQEAKASEKESQAGFLKGMSEALSTWWAKPWFERSVAGTQESTSELDTLVSHRAPLFDDDALSVITEGTNESGGSHQEEEVEQPQAFAQRGMMSRFKNMMGWGRSSEPNQPEKSLEEQQEPRLAELEQALKEAGENLRALTALTAKLGEDRDDTRINALTTQIATLEREIEELKNPASRLSNS